MLAEIDGKIYGVSSELDDVKVGDVDAVLAVLNGESDDAEIIRRLQVCGVVVSHRGGVISTE